MHVASLQLMYSTSLGVLYTPCHVLQRWHTQLTAVIEDLRVAAGLPRQQQPSPSKAAAPGGSREQNRESYAQSQSSYQGPNDNRVLQPSEAG